MYDQEQALTLEQQAINNLALFMEGNSHLNGQDNDGNTALHRRVTHQGRLEIVRALVNYGAKN